MLEEPKIIKAVPITGAFELEDLFGCKGDLGDVVDATNRLQELLAEKSEDSLAIFSLWTFADSPQRWHARTLQSQ